MGGMIAAYGLGLIQSVNVMIQAASAALLFSLQQIGGKSLIISDVEDLIPCDPWCMGSICMRIFGAGLVSGATILTRKACCIDFGKSGSFFYLTTDDKYMIRTMKKAKAKVLLRMLNSYYDHVRAFENTLVTRYYTRHCVKLAGPTQNKRNFNRAMILKRFVSGL